ncbi:FUSC family protein [Bradyrhizobium sp. Arg237L]|uniref:FUSC family protein n=1 Tax=Bradyrhizobium sp. Arg237L TaxID=3003352 RepID=UPI00249E72B6|nr:FUSC family protein [Bradyrhizobium sp. Arg237L]MDI4236547.1 FUSC family protein [Bradyrhizobium sp. Arg237L]
MRSDQSFLVRHANLVFAFKTFLAAALALVVALWIDLARPYWAMATVYIASQPLAGATSSKALSRVLGTVVGAIVSVILVPNLVNAPELLCLVVALWVGLCLYLSLLERSPRSYAFMLAGYTVALIGFPAVSDPGSIFDTALARVEEITLGIICATLVSTIVFPRSVAPAVAARVNNWLSDASRLSQDVLSGRGAERVHRAQRLRLATDAVEIDALAGHLAYDRFADANAVSGLQALRLHMLMLLPLLSSITDRIAALGGRLGECSPQLPRLLDDLGRWLAADAGERQPADVLRAAIMSLRPKLDAHSSWDQVTAANLLIRLRELVDVSDDCRALNRAIAVGKDVSGLRLAFLPEASIAPARHRDHGLALWSGAGAAFAVLVCCAFWIGTGWVDGASAPMMAAIGCSFFAAQDDPAPSIRSFAWWSLASVAVVAIYLFAIIPAISTVEVLIAALAPSFILFGVLIARPRTNFIGMALAANSATLLALQSTYDADFASFTNAAIALLLGMAAAAVITRLARSVGAEWVARRLMKTSWATLALTAERRGKNDRARFAGLMLDRLGLLVQRFAVIPGVDRRDVDGLTQLRVGLNIIDLRRARHKLTPATLSAIDDMLDQLALACREHVSGPLPPELLRLIDVALAEALNEPEDGARDDALIGLIGIRRGLFPDALAYQPQSPHPRNLAA